MSMIPRRQAIFGGRRPNRRRVIALGSALLVALTAGCARTITSENLASFSEAATAISKQSELSFDESNKLAREFAISRFIRSGAPVLAEGQFQGAVTRESIDAWKEALTALSDYGTTL